MNYRELLICEIPFKFCMCCVITDIILIKIFNRMFYKIMYLLIYVLIGDEIGDTCHHRIVTCP